MSSIIMRSALVHWGRKNIPANLHSIVDGRVVTWDEVMAGRREHQKHRLNYIRQVTVPRAWRIWVAYYDMTLMGGWQAMIDYYKPDCYDGGRVWIDRDCRPLKPVLMATFPLVLPLGSESEQWEAWKPAFARAYARRSQHRHPLGVAYAWWDRNSRVLTPVKAHG